MDMSEKKAKNTTDERAFVNEMVKDLKRKAENNFQDIPKPSAEERAKCAELKKLQAKKSEFMALQKIRALVFKQYDERKAAKENGEQEQDGANSEVFNAFEKMMDSKLAATGNLLEEELQKLAIQKKAVLVTEKYEDELNLCKTVELKTMLDSAKQLKDLMQEDAANMFADNDGENDNGNGGDGDEPEGQEEEKRMLLRIHRQNVNLANLVMKMIFKGGLGNYKFRSPKMLKVRIIIEAILDGSYDFERAKNRFKLY